MKNIKDLQKGVSFTAETCVPLCLLFLVENMWIGEDTKHFVDAKIFIFNKKIAFPVISEKE